MLVMADVAGKSVPAALLMATLQASLHTIASEGFPLAELAKRLNHYASAHSLDGRRFTTAVIGEYEPATRRFTYVNAGHNAPDPPSRQRHAPNASNPAVFPSASPAKQSSWPPKFILQPGDTLILFTDGVVEAFNSSGQEFSDERWVSIVRALPIHARQGNTSIPYEAGRRFRRRHPPVRRHHLPRSALPLEILPLAAAQPDHEFSANTGIRENVILRSAVCDEVSRPPRRDYF